jgi:hypothetical protein
VTVLLEEDEGEEEEAEEDEEVEAAVVLLLEEELEEELLEPLMFAIWNSKVSEITLFKTVPSDAVMVGDVRAMVTSHMFP